MRKEEGSEESGLQQPGGEVGAAAATAGRKGIEGIEGIEEGREEEGGGAGANFNSRKGVHQRQTHNPKKASEIAKCREGGATAVIIIREVSGVKQLSASGYVLTSEGGGSKSSREEEKTDR